VFVYAPWLIKCFFTASWSPLEERIVDDNLRFIFLSLALLCALRCKLFVISTLYQTGRSREAD
jgi:hypothetical protein